MYPKECPCNFKTLEMSTEVKEGETATPNQIWAARKHFIVITAQGRSLEYRRQKNWIYIYIYYILYIYILNLYFLEGWSLESAGKKNYFFFQLIFFGGLVAGKSAAKKNEKNICFIFLKHIFFEGLVAGKSAAKTTGKDISLNCFKTYETYVFWCFLEGWSLENRRQKDWKKCVKTYIFWRAGRGKIGGKNTEKIFFF